ncbi:phosphoglucosamine mutase [Shewanella intestini]|uniref:Phosphoglucosamine mutase n=2 Tax=Shewanellaceae TaxID=267890 RepID=A0ABS5HXJ4_9GAMM|nr:phosphoglucosamine mutase [Shewanella intestini]MRG34969.1 phosphoglucosamine mutase [Shewanella sp. XMDDZSB0408]
MTPELALNLGWATGIALAKQGAKKVLIGKDTRISGYLFESALEAGLSAAGVDIYLVGPMPMPGVVYLTRTFNVQAGIVISASHQPFNHNGIRFFCGNGLHFSDELAHDIEQLLSSPLHCVSSKQLGKAHRISDAAGRYIEYCKGHFPAKYTLEGLKIVVDCAHGAAYHIAPNVFKQLGAQVICVGVSPNGVNINDGVGTLAMEKVCQTVLTEHADLGIALDGDGDRILLVNADGKVINGDEILYILAADALKRGDLKGGVVSTQVTNLSLALALKQLNIPFMVAQPGSKHIIEQLKRVNWQIGGDRSGHIVHLEHGTTGDGIVTGLLVLAAMCRQQCTLCELLRPYTRLPQVTYQSSLTSDGQDHIVNT